jgi:hypothetical protein
METKPLLIGLVCAVAAGGFAVWPRKPGSVAFGIQHHTNGYAYFSITNLHHFTIQYGVAIERKSASGWPDYYGDHSYSPGPLRHKPPEGFSDTPALAPMEFSAFKVCVAKEAGPWRLSVCYFRKQTPLDSARFRAGQFFAMHGMRTLELWVYPPRGRARIEKGAELTNFTANF